MELTTELAFSIYRMGIDTGQLWMEKERDSEDVSDAFQGFIIDMKYSMPAAAAPRRMPHTEAWRNAKKQGQTAFMDLLVKLQKQR